MRKINLILSRRRLLMTAVLALPIDAGAARAQTLRVTIDKMAFSPAELTAKAGDTIEWINNDVFAHTATVKGGFEVMLPPKKSGSVVVETAGTIDYYCRFHPNMKGRIAVSGP
ncbi:MAG: cupredoxin family copper-binding protein [Parvibaculaceae bacterium]